MSPAPWYDPYTGLPWPLQALYWVVLVLACASVVSTVVLAVNGLVVRRRATADGEEGDYLWVFVVPALNEEVTIGDSVARLRAARATHKVILVVDDGSDDGTPEILADLRGPDLHVLRRDPPDARRGKAAALNAAWRSIHASLATPRYANWTTDRVIIVVVDADGRLSADAPQCLARHFANGRVAGVQSLVRIYNRRGLLTWAQDMEFGVFGWVFQLGRTAWGTANMGGNGQANRLRALDDVVEGDGPWRDRLTEDQDIGVRLLQAGWCGAQETTATVEQQGLSSLNRLYRQRTRWAQGAFEAVPLITRVARARHSLVARLDMAYYLLTPVLQLFIGAALVSALVVAATTDLSAWPRAWPILVFFATLSFAPAVVGLVGRGRGLKAVVVGLLSLIPYLLYSWLIFPVLVRALVRLVLGRSTWAKTAREPLEPGIHTEI